jgi:hypothetical protein
MKKAMLFYLLLLAFNTNAQMLQTIRGRVIDKESEFPLIGVNVIISNSNPIIGASTNDEGEFFLP